MNRRSFFKSIAAVSSTVSSGCIVGSDNKREDQNRGNYEDPGRSNTDSFSNRDSENSDIDQARIDLGFSATGLSWDGTQLYTISVTEQDVIAINPDSGTTERVIDLNPALGVSAASIQGFEWVGEDILLSGFASGIKKLNENKEMEKTIRFDVTDIHLSGISHGDDSLWIAHSAESIYKTGLSGDKVDRIDIQKELGFNAPSGVAYGDGLWITENATNRAQQQGKISKLFRVDPSTGEVIDSTPVRSKGDAFNNVTSLTFADQRLWALDGSVVYPVSI